MIHPYIRFRTRLARHAVAQLAARLRGSAEIVVVVLGPAVVGLLAFAALPAMLAASQPLPLALPLLLLHGAAMSLPVALLRPRIVPAGVRAWLQPLPVPARLEWQAGAAVAAVLVLPLALAYLASLAIWSGQHPAWLAPRRAPAGTALSLLLTWACATWLLASAGGPPRPRRAPPRAVPDATWTARPRHGVMYVWRQLFWLPLWRNGSLAGARQAVLLAATGAAFLAWMAAPLPRTAGAIATSVLLVLLAHDADTVLRAQADRVRLLAAGWPLDAGALVRRARALLLLALAAVLSVAGVAGAARGAWHGGAGRLWLLLACLAPALLVLTPPLTARGRMALVALCIVVLCAVGSKVWH
ncbi:hypothetical protein [uncultured Massilia sp.]|uniref:hypothetical protein n=1 Tax=uncultured Massilia sp. TaxID=169973 RepID=UPI0025E85718|nr:hypothetical protein [uncultured Massilia sp.]